MHIEIELDMLTEILGKLVSISTTGGLRITARFVFFPPEARVEEDNEGQNTNVGFINRRPSPTMSTLSSS